MEKGSCAPKSCRAPECYAFDFDEDSHACWSASSARVGFVLFASAGLAALGSDPPGIAPFFGPWLFSVLVEQVGCGVRVRRRGVFDILPKWF